MKASIRAGVARDERRRDELGELRDRELLVVVADRARPVEHARALALGELEQVRRVDVLHVERRVLAHQHRGEVRERAAPPARPAAYQSWSSGASVERHDARPACRRASQQRSACSSANTAWPRARERAHHRDARVLVGLELGQRIEDEGEVHGGPA